MQGQDSDRLDGHSYTDRTTDPGDLEPLVCLAGLRQRTPEVGMARGCGMAWGAGGTWQIKGKGLSGGAGSHKPTFPDSVTGN